MRKSILFVCSINRMRSATAHEIYKNDSRFNINSAETDTEAANIITEQLLNQADAVIVMERHHRNSIRTKFPQMYKSKKIVSLYIPDEFDYMQSELITIIKQRFDDVYAKG